MIADLAGKPCLHDTITGLPARALFSGYLMPSELITERRGDILVLTISGPASRNTLSLQVCAAGVESLNVAESDDAVRCVVLQGAGAHFSAGANLNRLLESARPEFHPRAGQGVEGLHQLVEALRVFPKPVIAAVEGTAAGSGFALALACDLIVAAEDARFSMSYGRVGLSPDGGSSWHLMQMLPRQLAMQMMWLAEPSMSARQLHSFGVVNGVTDSGHALELALSMGNRLAQMPSNTVASIKELAYRWPGSTVAEHMSIEAEHFVANLKHPNAVEGIDAFLEKRPARFT